MKLCLRTAIPVLSTAALFTSLALAQVESTGGATATFDAAGPGGLNIHGSTSDLAAAEKDGKVIVTVQLRNLTTGINLRDEHMRDKYLEVEQFPTAAVAVKRSDLKFPSKGSESKGTVTGTMTIHGVTKPVSLRYDAAGHGDKIAVDGTSEIDMRDFGVEVPSYLGVGVDPHVTLKVHFKVVDR
jgi:polyisoprenoid-binding protein YceI